MRWLIIALMSIVAIWRAPAQDMPLSQVLIEGEGWREAIRNVADQSRSCKADVREVAQPTCMAMSPDDGTVFVGSAVGKYVWAFRIEHDGTLGAGQPYCSLFTRRGTKDMPVSALAVDADGRVYAATPAGVQIFDPTGRLCGVLTNPSNEPVIGLAIGNGELRAATGTKTYVRKVKVKRVTAQ